jgi:hypothetical protein
MGKKTTAHFFDELFDYHPIRQYMMTATLLHPNQSMVLNETPKLVLMLELESVET